MRHLGMMYREHTGRIAVIVVAAGAMSIATLASNTSGAATAHTSNSVEVATAKNATLGTILVSRGRTLYILNRTACPSTCLVYWPPVLLPAGVAKATAGPGVNAANLGKVKDAKGAWQVTYAGKALYWFLKDTASSQVNGNNLKDSWGLWTVIVTAKPKPSGSGGTTSTTAPTTTTTNPGTGGSGGVSF